eukprot:4137847-Lingulodinium_polyedra.AAC.1
MGDAGSWHVPPDEVQAVSTRLSEVFAGHEDGALVGRTLAAMGLTVPDLVQTKPPDLRDPNTRAKLHGNVGRKLAKASVQVAKSRERLEAAQRDLLGAQQR